jgi:hypothetical protein
MSGSIDSILRPELEALPDRLRKLPIHRGYPVPWFVDWEDGVPEFRAMDGRKRVQAINNKLCWVCGEPLGKYLVFVAGPMCGINRTSAEPPCHRECAQWSARNCPFLSKPQMTRRKMETAIDAPGIMLDRNPGVTLLWTTLSYSVFSAPGGFLLHMGEPVSVEWWTEGKSATRAQVEASVASGLPKLIEAASIAEVEDAMRELREQAKAFEALYPAA